MIRKGSSAIIVVVIIRYHNYLFIHSTLLLKKFACFLIELSVNLLMSVFEIKGINPNTYCIVLNGNSIHSKYEINKMDLVIIPNLFYKYKNITNLL